MQEKLLKNVKNLTKKTLDISTKNIDNVKNYTEEKVISKIKKSTENTKLFVSNTTNKLVDEIKFNISEEQMMHLLNTLYTKSIDGIPKISLPVNDLVDDYIKRNSDISVAAKSLIYNSTIKCGTSGFLTGLGGISTIVATLLANITSVMYVQLRMCCAIAKMAGYDIRSDQVQTLIYACLTGSAISDVLKQAGIKFGNKFSEAMIKKIPGKTLQAINKKVGFRFVTKFGKTGIVNFGKVVPVIGGVIGGGIDIASTKVIGNNAYKIFIKGEVSNKVENINVEDYKIIDDIDCKMLQVNMKAK